MAATNGNPDGEMRELLAAIADALDLPRSADPQGFDRREQLILSRVSWVVGAVQAVLDNPADSPRHATSALRGLTAGPLPYEVKS